jgi:hypothetical protein
MREQKDARPRVDALTAPTSNTYTLFQLSHPSLESNMTREQITEEAKKVFECNQYIRPLNDDKLRDKVKSEAANRTWSVQDAQLQISLLSSVDNTLSNAIHTYKSAHKMHQALKGLHNVSDHDNLRRPPR